MTVNVKDENPMSIPWRHYSLNDWDNKKKNILEVLPKDKFTDYGSGDPMPPYSETIHQCIKDEMHDFSKWYDYPVVPKGVWYERSKKTYRHPVHNHGTTGFSGVLYVDFDPEVHQSTVFYLPFTEPTTGTVLTYQPKVKEGDLVIFPSYLLHEAVPNESDKERVIVSFNIMCQKLLFACKDQLFGYNADYIMNDMMEKTNRKYKTPCYNI